MALVSKFAAGDEPEEFSVKKFPFEYLILDKADYQYGEGNRYPESVLTILCEYEHYISVSNMSPYRKFYVDREIDSSEINEIKREGYQIYRKI